MTQDIISFGKSYHFEPCPHCGGRFYFDEEEQEWHCLNCARRPERPVSTTDNRVSANDNPLTTGDKLVITNKNTINVNKNRQSKAIEKPRNRIDKFDNSKKERAFVSAPEPEKIYEGHSLEGAWWPPREITFRRKQMLFLIKSLPELREGHWPVDPDRSSSVDLPMIKKGKAGRRTAYFEVPASIAAEVEARLEKCGMDGLVLEAIECWEKTEASMAKYFGVPEWSIRKRAKNALRYISGWERRKQSYKDSISHKR